nr:aminoacetone oxidase family FAD-binding enzyme [Brackiella oedipodis]
MTVKQLSQYDAIIIGAGAAGMMCAAQAAARGLHVLLLDHASKLAEKIRISGGGRCNFTNLGATWQHYVSNNPRFARYALSVFGPQDFLALLQQYKISWHEKHKGQLFCDNSSQDIIHMLSHMCNQHQVEWLMPCKIHAVQYHEQPRHYTVQTSRGTLKTPQLVIATGGLAMPQLGASAFALNLAKQFTINVIPVAPALVPLQFDPQHWAAFANLSGVSINAHIRNGTHKKAQSFDEDVLFTHKGLSGPGILQISSYWQAGSDIVLDLAPAEDVATILLEAKQHRKQQLLTVLSRLLPRRLAQIWLAQFAPNTASQMAEISDKTLRQLAQHIKQWSVQPCSSAGYKKAEAMRGGVDTQAMHATSMEVKAQPGLFFIGEAVDMTGWLGGYNFQWAWSSAYVCAQALQSSSK